MSRGVVTITRGTSMGMVARLFRRREISSAPVVDEGGHCVGILSAADFVKREYALDQPATSGNRQNASAGAEGVFAAEVLSPPASSDVSETYMTSAVQSIDPDRSLLAAARMMCASHIHRLLVLDAAGSPVGMLSTMDIMAALLNAIDEAELTSP